MDKKRPKPKSMVLYDTNNYYSQLGISPLTPTEEIIAMVNTRQMEARHQKNVSDGESGDSEFIRLQRILDAIGSAKKRETYDYNNPHNLVLTVQPDPYDKWLDSQYQANLLTAILFEITDGKHEMPHPDSAFLWSPQPIKTTPKP
jgi:hypothetical protein